MKLLAYLAVIYLLFFSPTYAVTTDELPIVKVSPILIGGNAEQQDLIDYAWSISNDMDFILTIFAKSGFRPYAVGDQGRALGLCQWRPDLGWKRLTDDPRFQDGHFQIDSCWNSYTVWRDSGKLKNRLYGYNVRLKHKARFEMRLSGL